MAKENSAELTIELKESFRGSTSDINCVRFSPDHHSQPFLAAGSSDKTIRLWNLNDQSTKTLTRHTYQVHWLTFAPICNDEKETSIKYMASASTDGTCLLWDLQSISVLKQFRHDSGSPIRVCEFSTDGLLLATAGDDELINLWDITASSTRPLKTFSGHSSSIVALRFFSNFLISGSFYGDLRLWTLDSSFTGPIFLQREAHDLGVTCLDIVQPIEDETHQKSNVLIASGGNDNLVNIWTCSSSSKTQLTLLRTLKKHSCAVMCVSFGIKHYLASGSGDKTIVIWNYETGQCLHQFEAHSRYVTCCAFSIDGKYLASGSNDRMVNLWQIDYGEQNRDSSSNLKSEKFDYQLHSIDQWTSDMVQQWLSKYRINVRVQLNGNELLMKSDEEIADLFDNNEKLMNELSSLRHQNFMKKLSAKKTSQFLLNNDQEKSSMPNEFLCPITQELMRDPVCASDGYTYERKAIEEWLIKKKTSPIMNSSIKGTQLYPNKVLKMLIDRYLEEH